MSKRTSSRNIKNVVYDNENDYDDEIQFGIAHKSRKSSSSSSSPTLSLDEENKKVAIVLINRASRLDLERYNL